MKVELIQSIVSNYGGSWILVLAGTKGTVIQINTESNVTVVWETAALANGDKVKDYYVTVNPIHLKKI